MIKEIIQNTLDFVTETTKEQCIKTLQLFTAEELDVASILQAVVHKYPPHQGLLILTVLDALKLENAISQTLTQCDDAGLNLYYQALKKYRSASHYAAQLIQKLAQYSESLTTDEQLLIHFNPKAFKEAALYQFITPNNFFKLEWCLQFIFKLAQTNEDFSNAVNNHLLTDDSNHPYFLKTILASGNQRLVALIINHFKEKVFFPVINKQDAPHILHILTYYHTLSANTLSVIFKELNKSIHNQTVSPTVYASILLNTFKYQKEDVQRTLLSLGLLDANKGQLIMTEAKMAFYKGWLSAEQYYSFLFDHPSSEPGFSFLHEAIRSSSYKIFYCYITHCLDAIAENVSLLDRFKQQLLTPNKANFSLLGQGINNRFLENTELLLNLFYLLFPAEVFKEQRLAKLSCYKDKPEHIFINRLIAKFKTIVGNNIPALVPIVSENPSMITPYEEQLEQKKQLNYIIDTIYLILERYKPANEATVAGEAYARHGFLTASTPSPQPIPCLPLDSLDTGYTMSS